MGHATNATEPHWLGFGPRRPKSQNKIQQMLHNMNCRCSELPAGISQVVAEVGVRITSPSAVNLLDLLLKRHIISLTVEPPKREPHDRVPDAGTYDSC